MKQKPTIVLTGGGSGGHITPSLSVAHELKIQLPDARLVFIGQKNDPLQQLVRDDTVIDELHLIRAGKLRRYHGVSLFRQLLDIRSQLFNIRDSMFLLIGYFQSLVLLWRLRPAVIFIKGGYVGVPVAMAARFWKLPYITHDSDAMAGLANRLIAKGARLHATGMPSEFYDYPAAKSVYTGVPVDARFQPLSKGALAKAKKNLGVPTNSLVVLSIGGGLGASRVNHLLVGSAPQLLSSYPDLHIIHLTGQQTYQSTLDAYNEALDESQMKRMTILDFTPAVYRYSAAADVVISRAGATAISEFARQSKACLLIPNPLLAGGHQLKNAEELALKKAAMIVDESAPAAEFIKMLQLLLDNEALRVQLASRLHTFGVHDAASRIARLLVEVGNLQAEK